MAILLKRDDDDYIFGTYFYNEKANIIKWSIFFGLLALIIAFVTISYIHAGRRLKKGLEPLAYHRWTVSRKRRGRLHPNGAEPPVYVVYTNDPNAAGSYYMHSVPPPVYVPGNGPPPLYPGPPPAAKSNTDVQNPAFGEGAAGGQQLGTTGGEPVQPAYHPPAQGGSLQYR